MNCDSYHVCSINVNSRNTLVNEPLYDARANKSVFVIPGSEMPLHVPIMKLHNGSNQAVAVGVRGATGKTASKLARTEYPVFRASNKSFDHGVCQKNCTPADQLYMPWPLRKEVANVHWTRLGTPSASKFTKCGPGFHWYCGHFAASYVAYHAGVYSSCYGSLGVFERPDVRLVLDIGGATAAFAHAIHDQFGDTIVTMTGAFWSSLMDGGYNHIAPVAQFGAARGFPVVMVDAMGYLPFAENTLDVIHSSWVYHGGVPTATVYEFYRVLRPGGFLVLRQSINSAGTFGHIKKIAAKEGWRLHREGGCGTHGSTIVWQMPIY